MLVTTAYSPSSELIERARAVAGRLAARYVDRRHSSIPRLRKLYREPDFFLVTDTELRFCPAGAPELFFHPSTAIIRIKRMERGEPDLLTRLAGVREGDAILDCTAGLASDAIVFAYAAGPGGRVTALESEPVLAFLVGEGLASYSTGLPALDEAMRRVSLLRQEHFAFLQSQPDRSYDIVYFDPMFRSPIDDASAIEPLREVANCGALSPETIREARRVARRAVVLKENRDSREFARLGFEKIGRGHSKVAYGVMKL